MENYKFKHAIVRKPCKNFQNGITTSSLGKPEYKKAVLQHSNYIEALKKCGLKIVELKPDERFPDSTFIEDTAIVDKEFALIANLGAQSRQGEEIEVKEVLRDFYDRIEIIRSPGTIEGGDVMKVENSYCVGLSNRTNQEGIRQFKEILKRYGYGCTTIPLKNFLHLKTGVAYLGKNNFIVSDKLAISLFFKDLNMIPVNEDETYAANSIKVNDYIIMPKGFEKLKKAILRRGYEVLEVDMSEFRKMDGGVSCLSLRF